MSAPEMPKALQESINSTKVSYKQLGKSGLRVSIPVLGAMSFGHQDWAPWVVSDESKVFDLLKAAYDCGLNTWDTANIYSNGVSEELIGKAIKKLNLPRAKLTILTKCFGAVGEEPAVANIRFPQMKETKDYINQSGLSRTAIFNAVDASLARLQLDYVDLLQIHRFDASVPIEETMRALHDLVHSGKVRYIGASSMWAYQFAQMQFCAEKNGWTKFISMQNHYSLCYREEEREMNKYCHETGVGLLPWAPLYRGHLARPLGGEKTQRESTTPASFGSVAGADEEIIGRVQKLAEEKGWKMSQVALAWIIQKDTCPIVGFSSAERLLEAVDVKGKTLTDDEMKNLEEPYVPKKIMGHQ